MSYSINLHIYQKDPNFGSFSIVEQTVWYYANGGTWSESSGALTLTMGGSGTSGVIRFKSTKGELITVAVGVHNYKRWCDVVTGLKPEETALKINGQYYNNGGRDWVREKQETEHTATSPSGTKVTIKYTVTEGSNLAANIIIG
ncbi:lectin [Boletus coccyginus]|nr:lectin [Boletus coccyginus]